MKNHVFSQCFVNLTTLSFLKWEYIPRSSSDKGFPWVWMIIQLQFKGNYSKDNWLKIEVSENVRKREGESEKVRVSLSRMSKWELFQSLTFAVSGFKVPGVWISFPLPPSSPSLYSVFLCVDLIFRWKIYIDSYGVFLHLHVLTKRDC